MASYMPQSDSGGNCCDCPDRTDPCDDCLGPCGCPGLVPYESGGICYSTLTIDGSLSGTDCGGGGLSNVVDCTLQFRTMTCYNEPCSPGWTGSCTAIYQIDEADCVLKLVSCVGTIYDEFHVPQSGCGMSPGCDCESAAIATKNVTTLSNPCTP